MSDIQKRMDKAVKLFTPEFLALTTVDPIAKHVFTQVIAGNAYKCLEQLVSRVNEQQSTINNLVSTYGPNYRHLIDTS
jgi:uncharacterized protein YigE (DUF2233 family)